MRDRLRVEHERAERARGFEPAQDAVVLHGAEHLDGARGIAEQLAHAVGDRLRHLVERQVAFGRVDAVARDVDVLRRRAHLARYSDSENATLRATAFMSAALSTMIWFTPAFSV